MNIRSFRLGLAAAGLFLAAGTVAAGELPKMTVYKDPYCGCCTAWAERMREAGFDVNVVIRGDMLSVKSELGVSDDLASCHTATVGKYVLEGHVPPAEVVRLLEEKPAAIGLAVPGMPMGSPGMGVPGMGADDYEVVLFSASNNSPYASYSGEKRTD
ncbi:DUF411 domain-containing protein [Afifella sp. IM 167]|uniref:DUF411 domain-containing protein n=1 Tax=Afifella sp. IM 167 TaxID=2033586 RepID=UPI001CCA5482|nr:DUF411 domain-containing protein [Afifella sp. IM 167]MBZ8134287.1 metal-binding protein [Afifella sp. IM 167]